MALKTDYKDDVFSGNRKYQKTDNSDGTISLVDKTSYSQKGDTFSASDINATNKAVNELKTHSHGLLNQVLGTSNTVETTSGTWDDMIGDGGEVSGPILKAFRTGAKAPEWLLDNVASGIAFGAVDVRASITVDYAYPRIRVAGCNRNHINWYADLLNSLNYTQYVKSTTKSFTLSASGWVSAGGWDKYVITDSLVTATSNQEVVPSPSINREQFKALQKANLVGTQENGIMYLWVYGAVPTIDIPITVIFRGVI